MKKIILEGILGDKFGKEWELDVSSPSDVVSAIGVQKKGFREFLIGSSEDGLNYEVLIDGEGVQSLEEYVHPVPQNATISFIPIVAGSKSRLGMILTGIALVIAAPYMAGAFAQVVGAGGATSIGSTAGTLKGLGATGALQAGAAAGAAGATGVAATMGIYAAATFAGYGLIFGGAAQYLTPKVEDGKSAITAENYLFNGAINTVRQGGPVPLVYGRMVTGSSVISASLFTQTSSTKAGVESAAARMVGISNFRTGGATYGENTPGTGSQGPQGPARGGCFAAGSLVHMADGSFKAIEDLTVGELIQSYNFEKEYQETKPILQLMVPRPDTVYDVVTTKGTTRMTGGQLVYSKLGWACIDKNAYQKENEQYGDLGIEPVTLKIGNSLEYAEILNITRVGVEMVYHLSSIQDNHNYYVDGILAHNRQNVGQQIKA
jgi:predicted phage tail protein